MLSNDSMELLLNDIRRQTVLIDKCLDNKKLMDSLKNCSVLLNNLRNDKLSPKQYYEVYVVIFDSLERLSNFLKEFNGGYYYSAKNLVELYELVQYSGNILPRLYLLITIGSLYLSVESSPSGELLKDMIEMCRGVQNPIRGLFLRYYLSQKTKDYFLVSGEREGGEEDKNFDCSFVMTNFIEMNKLWVRMQHQSFSKNKDKTLVERSELKILVGSQLVRLSQIIENDFELYNDFFLPKILEQIIQCNDILSQEYLFDVIIQIFPLEYNLKVLDDKFLPNILKLNNNESIKKIINILITRILITHTDIDHSQILNSFLNFLNQFIEKRPDLSILFFISIIEKYLSLTIYLNIKTFENIDLIFALVYEKLIEFGNLNLTPADFQAIKDLLLFKTQQVNSTGLTPLFYLNVIINSKKYNDLLLLQPIKNQKQIIEVTLDKLLSVRISKESEILHNFKINSISQLENILLFIEPIIKISDDDNINGETIPINGYGNIKNDKVGNSMFHFCNPVQEKLGKFLHLLVEKQNLCPDNKSVKKKIQSSIEYYLIIKNWFYKGGSNSYFTFPVIITYFWKIIRYIDLVKLKYVEKHKDDEIEKQIQYFDHQIKQCFKLISRCIADIYHLCNLDGSNNRLGEHIMDNAIYDTVFKLNLQCASLADQLTFNEISYDFFSQAFTLYEEKLNDSKTQFQSLIYLAQTLQKTRSLHSHDDNYYDNLIVRCTLHSSKLLKKQDQCRSVYLCSHLWWATEISSIGEEEDETDTFYRDGKRVLECLQRSLRVADSIMDNIQSCQLMVEILSRCIYYFVHSSSAYDSHISIKYINGLIELIKTNLSGLKLERNTILSGTFQNDANNSTEVREDESTNIDPIIETHSLSNISVGIDGSYLRVNNLNQYNPKINSNHSSQLSEDSISLREKIEVPVHFFQRICQYIIEQRENDVRFNMIIV